MQIINFSLILRFGSKIEEPSIAKNGDKIMIIRCHYLGSVGCNNDGSSSVSREKLIPLYMILLNLPKCPNQNLKCVILLNSIFFVRIVLFLNN